MKRRPSLASAATETLSGLDPAYLAAKEKLAAGKIARRPVPRQAYGRTKEELSIIGFGGMVVKDVTPKEAANFVAEAVDRGVNYFDVAPFYGNAQRRLGPALKPYRQKCFLACKTLERDAAGSARELWESLKLLQTDHVDLYQLHALTDVEEVKQAFGTGGAMETLLLLLLPAKGQAHRGWYQQKPPLEMASNIRPPYHRQQAMLPVRVFIVFAAALAEFAHGYN